MFLNDKNKFADLFKINTKVFWFFLKVKSLSYQVTLFSSLLKLTKGNAAFRKKIVVCDQIEKYQ